MDPTGKLADYLVNTASESIPEQARALAKQAFIDYMGVTLAGSRSETGKLMIQFVREVGSQGRASVIGGNMYCHPTMAVLANGVSAHSLDYDDFILSLGHVTTILVSIGLALGEEADIDGKSILDAYVLAVEAGAKIAEIMLPGHRDRGWHNTGTLGTIAAATMAARLLRLNVDQTGASMALAASQAAGMLRNLGSMAKPFHAGNAARSGLTAALLARSGFTGAREVLGGALGFCQLYGGKEEDLEASLEKLGAPFHLVQAGITFKQYPCCAGIHPGIDILLELREKHSIHPEAVERIDCWVKKSLLNTMPYRVPHDADEARFSIPFCLATAMVSGRVGLDEFEDRKLARPETTALMNRINILSGDGENKVKLCVYVKNGDVFEAEKCSGKGAADISPAIGETVAKFLACSSGLLSPRLALAAIQMLEQFDSLSHIHTLMEILSRSEVAEERE